MNPTENNLAKKIGLHLMIIHFFVFVAFVVFIELSSEAQIRLLLSVWLIIDFPVSFLTLLAFEIVSGNSPINEKILYYMPYFIHGVLGSLWWYFLPRIMGYLFRRFNIRNNQ